MPEENKKTRSEIEGRINACNQELCTYDYAARKVAFETARTLKKLFPDEALPMFEKYKEIEANAEERRKEIRELEKELETAKDERV